MDIERKCLRCHYAVAEQNPTVEQRLQGQVPVLCLALPPSAQLVASAGGGMATVTFYPPVGADTISCGSFSQAHAAKPFPPIDDAGIPRMVS